MANIGYPDTKNKKGGNSSSPLFSMAGGSYKRKKVNSDTDDALATAQNEEGGFKKDEGTSKNVNRKTKGGGYNAQGVWVKTGGKATGKIKDYAVGSEARYKEYEARGWAHDDTTKGYKPKKDTSVKVTKKESKKKLDIAQAELNKQKAKKQQAKKSTVVRDAIETGKNTRKATRKTKRAAKQADKAAKINKRKQKRADAIAKRGGTRVGAGIRKVGNKIKNVFKKKDKK